MIPRFFTTYSPRVTRFFSSYRSRRSSELLLDATPTQASPLRSRIANTNPSASWPDHHSAKTLPGDYVELKDQQYKAGDLVPYAGGGFPPNTNSTTHSGNYKPRPHELTGLGNEAEECSRIWKTVHLSQSARHIQ